MASPDLLGGDLSRMSPELAAFLAEERAWGLSRPWRLDAFATQWLAATAAIFVRRRPVLAAVDAVTAPTLLVWGDGDPLVGRPTVDALLARQPGWRLRVLAGAGHAPPLEVPDDYVAAVSEEP
jgi:pimeloyl-ACP methyl ester carboxylesterase